MNRGTWSRFYRVKCRKCDCPVTLYQKDGPGELRRMYLDRFVGGSIYDLVPLDEIPLAPPLVCNNCGEIL